MLIEITVYFYPDDYNPEEDELIKGKPKLTKDIMIINSDHIVAYNPHERGETMVRMSNGEVFQTDYPFVKFNELMMGIDMAKKMMILDEN